MELGSWTRNLSFGLRPVWGEVTAQNGPPDVTIPSRRRRACSYSCEGVRFRYTRCSVDMPIALLGWPRVAAIFQRIDGGDHRHIHDVGDLRQPLQDMDRTGHPHKDRPNRLGVPQASEQLVGDVGGV